MLKLLLIDNVALTIPKWLFFAFLNLLLFNLTSALKAPAFQNLNQLSNITSPTQDVVARPNGLTTHFTMVGLHAIDGRDMQILTVWLAAKYAQMEPQLQLESTEFEYLSLPKVGIELEITEGDQFRVMHLVWALQDTQEVLARWAQHNQETKATVTYVEVSGTPVATLAFYPRDDGYRAAASMRRRDDEESGPTCGSATTHSQLSSATVVDQTSTTSETTLQALDFTIQLTPTYGVVNVEVTRLLPAMGQALLRVYDNPNILFGLVINHPDFHMKTAISEHSLGGRLHAITYKILQQMAAFAICHTGLMALSAVARSGSNIVGEVAFRQYGLIRDGSSNASMMTNSSSYQMKEY